jgi:hypothetical protein
MLRLLVSSVLFLAFSVTANAQVKLERKIVEGSTFTVSTTSNIEQKLTIAGMDTDTNADTRSVSKATVGKRDGLGMLRVQEKVESLQVNLTAAGQQYSFDSNNPDNKGGSVLEFIRDIHKALAKSVSTVVYDKNNRVHAVERDENLLASLPEQARDLVKGQVDPEQLKQNANQEIEKLPSDPVQKGDTWVRTETANFGAGQVMTFQTEYTYQGTVEKNGRTLDKITSKVMSVMFALQADSPLPLKLKGSELKADASEGTLLFDRELGRAAESTSSTHITGDITFTLNDMELPSKLDLKIKSTSTVGK